MSEDGGLLEIYLKLKLLTKTNFAPGEDSTARSLCLEALAGPADGGQTYRLAAIVMAMIEARHPKWKTL